VSGAEVTVDEGGLLGRLLGRWQVLIYLAAILLGVGIGTWVPAAGAMEPAIWPALGCLLLATFLQVPLDRLRQAAGDGRFLTAALVGNFVLVPLLVLGLLQLLPSEPAVRLGVAMVLLVPCTDWFITFAHLGGADARRAVVLTPLNLLLQLGALPLYLWLLLGDAFLEVLQAGRLGLVLVTLIVLPLTVAAVVQRRSRRDATLAHRLRRLEHLPVLLLALVLVLVAATQVAALPALGDVLAPVTTVYVAYLVAALVLARLLGAAAGLTPPAVRTVAFSLGSRNSFVVLPFALALPEAWALAVAVIVWQSLVELVGMLCYLQLVPRLIPTTRRISEDHR
jgi:arsenite transporter